MSIPQAYAQYLVLWQLRHCQMEVPARPGKRGAPYRIVPRKASQQGRGTYWGIYGTRNKVKVGTALNKVRTGLHHGDDKFHLTKLVDQLVDLLKQQGTGIKVKTARV